ncbi:hypothetical protein BX616_001768 [Lobosporangium transversale]|uniref:WD40-repeat-containing domain protein n=1 Tax=Lobosporangium transversale TaxID=64571 RepID=A0A1Y2GGW2_9FUNG|nr:WD40-repeat-containing domain protein [Lobosporangium transversale]KAF9917164.1 hypothetical protein BX616_001768 [Lobosporangium transversale]ORZ10579.1 WD40-repeat-containing domain protein [Lobosporangium transversale]|eukprot:XP_021879300.1 WD40-repeat-containing domain protein [Lobosporangium transversale]
MEYRRLVSDAHLMVQNFLQSQGYNDALKAFENEAKVVLEDIPQSTPPPKPLIEVLTDIRMSQLHNQLGQLNLPSSIEEQDLSAPGDGSMPDTADEVIQNLHSVNIIFARTAQVAVAPTWQDLDQDPSMTVKFIPALVTAAADRTVKFTMLKQKNTIEQQQQNTNDHGDHQPGEVFKIWQPHSGVALDIDFHPLFPELMLTSAMDKTVVLTNTVLGEEHQIFKDHAKFVVRAKFAMDGSRIITASHDKTVRIYKAIEEEETNNRSQEKRLPRYVLDKTLTFKGAVESLCVLPWPSNSGVSSVDNGICNETRPPTAVVGTRDDNYLHYINLSDYSVTKYNMNLNNDNWVSFTPMEISASPHNNGGYLLVSTDSPTGRQILFRTGSALQLFNYYGVPTDGFSTPRHVWDRTGKYFYVTGNDHKIYCLQVNNADDGAAVATVAGTRGTKQSHEQAIIRTLEGHTSVVRGLYMDYHRNMLVSCSFDKTVRTWVNCNFHNATSMAIDI